VWRKTVLHHHTTPNERAGDAFDPEALVARAVAEDVEVLAVTDHNSIHRVAAVREAAAGTTLVVMAGVEIDTDRGHVVALAPGADGDEALAEYIARAGVQPDTERPFQELIDILRTDSWSGVHTENT
jgi:predicted metal-dependent phosphoesterase TrpH